MRSWRVVLTSFLFACGTGASAPNIDSGTDSALASPDTVVVPTACDASLQSDVNNCGACGRVCAHRPNTVPSCQAGACAYECLAGFADCDGDRNATSSTGCEVNLATDSQHCGACTTACPATDARTMGRCTESRCAITCAAPFADCNNDALRPSGDGCETDTRASARHCGVCQNACSGACVAARCDGERTACSFFSSEIRHPGTLRVATDGEKFLVAWNDLDLSKLFVAALDERGRALGASREVADLESWWRYDLAFDGSSFVVAWEDESRNGVFARRYSAAGEPVAGEVRVFDASSLWVNVVGTANGFGVSTPGATALVRSDVTRRGVGAGSYYALGAFLGDGFLSVGTTQVRPATDRPFDWYALDFGILAADATTRLAPVRLDPAFSTSGTARPQLIALSDGPLLAAVSARPFAAGPGAGGFAQVGIGVLKFTREGQPLRTEVGVMGPDWKWVPNASTADSFALAPSIDRTSAVMTYRSIQPGDVRMVLRQQALSAGGVASGPASIIATPRAGSWFSLSTAVNARGALTMWTWSSHAGGASEVRAIEGVFVENDGTVAACP